MIGAYTGGLVEDVSVCGFQNRSSRGWFYLPDPIK